MSESQIKQAWITSLRLLAATPKSRNELAGKLSEKGYDGNVIRQTLDELEKQGILNDRAYAQNIVARKLHGQPSGRRKILFELKRHGIPPPLQEEAIAGITKEEETQRAREIGRARWERNQNLEKEKRKRKVYDFLIRRGFDFQLVRDLVEEFEAELPPSD